MPTSTDTLPTTDVKSTLNTDKINFTSTTHRRLQGHLLSNADDRFLFQMHSKGLLNGKESSFEVETFNHIKVLL